MVNWKLAKEDPYYSARELEERARTKRSASPGKSSQTSRRKKEASLWLYMGTLVVR